MFLRLVSQSLPDKRFEWYTGAEWSAQVHFMIAEQAGAQATVRGEPDAVAAPAIGVRHRRDDANRSHRAW